MAHLSTGSSRPPFPFTARPRSEHTPPRSQAMRVPSTLIREQLVSVFRAWGMSPAHADTTAEMMVETDLRGVDSHGVSMLPTYDHEFRQGRINIRPVFKTARGGGAMDLLEADASLRQPARAHALDR